MKISWTRIAGHVLHTLVGGVMLMAGSGKAFGFAPQEIVESMSKHGLGDKLQLIGGGEMLSGLLLIIPWTSSLGVLLTSSFWGGAICIHMAHNESYLVPAVLLVMTWVGAVLRDRRALWSFDRPAALPRTPLAG
ncbi:MAG: DoxX family protein [Planctomyces sp.]|nr:DoxX family protein [Planctomyces sp.]